MQLFPNRQNVSQGFIAAITSFALHSPKPGHLSLTQLSGCVALTQLGGQLPRTVAVLFLPSAPDAGRRAEDYLLQSCQMSTDLGRCRSPSKHLPRAEGAPHLVLFALWLCSRCRADCTARADTDVASRLAGPCASAAKSIPVWVSTHSTPQAPCSGGSACSRSPRHPAKPRGAHPFSHTSCQLPAAQGSQTSSF